MLLRFCGKRFRQIHKEIYNVRSRLISTTKLNSGESYHGDGKTKVNILNTEEDLGLMINGVSQVGFRLNNDVTVLGSMVIFPRSILAWNVRHMNDITPETLSIFTILEPKLEIVIIGVGDSLDDRNFYTRILPLMKIHKINVEVLPTEQACSTFNFLNSEGRYVGGAFIPPYKLQTTDDELLKSKLRYQSLYEIHD